MGLVRPLLLKNKALSVSHVYQIPQLTHNLLSIGKLTELGFSLTFSSNGVVVQDSQMG